VECDSLLWVGGAISIKNNAALELVAVAQGEPVIEYTRRLEERQSQQKQEKRQSQQKQEKQEKQENQNEKLGQGQEEEEGDEPTPEPAALNDPWRRRRLALLNLRSHSSKSDGVPTLRRQRLAGSTASGP